MKSSDFRKTYASLSEPTDVTVNGHVIGRWIPSPFFAQFNKAVGQVEEELTKELGLEPGLRAEFDRRPFNSKPFTPVPKPGGKS